MRLTSTPGAVSALLGEATRLSLAGAQDKLPVRPDGDDLYVPQGAAASTHILELASHDDANWWKTSICA